MKNEGKAWQDNFLQITAGAAFVYREALQSNQVKRSRR